MVHLMMMWCIVVVILLWSTETEAKCPGLQPTSNGEVEAVPIKYTILTATLYEDNACSPTSSEYRRTPNTPVNCSRQNQRSFPQLINCDAGPYNGSELENSNMHTYTISGRSRTGLPEDWLRFDFSQLISLKRVLLYHYCLETHGSQKFRITIIGEKMLPICKSQHREMTEFRPSPTNKFVNHVVISVEGGEGTFRLSEVQFFVEKDDGATNVTSRCTCASSTATPGPSSSSTQMALSTSSTIRLVTAQRPQHDNLRSTIMLSLITAGSGAGIVICTAILLAMVLIYIRNRKRRKSETKKHYSLNDIHNIKIDGATSTEPIYATIETMLNYATLEDTKSHLAPENPYYASLAIGNGNLIRPLPLIPTEYSMPIDTLKAICNSSRLGDKCSSVVEKSSQNVNESTPGELDEVHATPCVIDGCVYDEPTMQSGKKTNQT